MNFHRFTFLLLLSLMLTQLGFSQSPRWRELPGAPIAGRMDDVFFVNPSVGWVASNNCSFYGCSGEIWKTTDGGASWALQFNAGTYVRSIGFVDSQTGWMGTIFDSTIPLYKTTDGGSSWHPVDSIPEPRPEGICGISIVNDSVVFASGRYYGPPRVIKTTDRGMTWSSMDLSQYAGGLVDCYFVNADSGFVVGSTSSDPYTGYPRVLFTSNGGNTWDTLYTGTRSGELCWKIQFRTPTAGYISIEKLSPGPTYYLKTTDGGKSWSEQLFLDSLYDVQGIGFVSETTDAGASWHLAGFGYLVNRFRFLSDKLAYAVGQSVYKYSIDSVTASWVTQSTTETNMLHDVFLADLNTGITVGENGTILHTTNGGASWGKAGSGLTTSHVFTLAAHDGDLFAGTSGGVFHSTNNGRNWTAINNGLTNSYVYTLVISADTLFAGTGEGVFASTDKGTNWNTINSGLTYTSVRALIIAPGGLGEVNLLAGTDGGGVFSSTNGINWTQTSLDTVHVTSLTAAGTNLFAGTFDGVFLSTDDGTSWTAVNSGLTNISVLSLAVAGANLFAGTSYGGVFLSTDNGTNWVQTTLDSLYVPCLFASGSNLFAGTNGAGVFLSTDNGASWTAANANLRNLDINSFAASPTGTSGTNVFLSAGPGVFLSTNEGANWTQQSGGESLNSLVFVDANTGTAVGSHGTVLRTTDGGGTWMGWTYQFSGATSSLYGVSFPDYEHGSAVGENGTIIRTTNGGANWTPQQSGTAVSLRSVLFMDANKGTVVGDDGTILRTTDGGENWSTQSSGTTAPLTGVFFIDSVTAIVVGSYGTILRTTNGGVNWSPQSAGTFASLESVFFTDINTGTAVGSYGTILRTTNGGTSWTLGSSGTNALLRSVWFTDANNGTVVGANGTILRTTTGGVVWVQEDRRLGMPSQFSLNQNYPNPFNPTTQIRFVLPLTSHVSLKIYDLLGREVATLVNDERKPGTYEATWEAAGFSSGVYFYRLTADSFVETKKLVLMR